MKYMGSKRRIARELHNQMAPALKKARRYVEPFAGGMNSIQEIPEDLVRVAGDNHLHLIKMWQALQVGWEPPEHITREQYYEIKSSETCDPALKGWVGFNCSYAGKWFDGYAGVTRTQSGVRDYQAEAIRHIQKQLPKLKDVQFVHSEYYDLPLEDKDVIYCDKPYENTRGYKMSFDHDQFWEWVRQVSQEHYVFVSEYEAPEDFTEVWARPLSSSISAGTPAGGTTHSVEKLFVLTNSLAYHTTGENNE